MTWMQLPRGVRIGIMVIGAAVLLNAFGGGKSATRNAPFKEQYPGPWVPGTTAEITIALARNGAHGCGEYFYRTAASSNSEALVYCKSASNTWTAYLVWLKSGDVVGPSQISGDLPLP